MKSEEYIQQIETLMNNQNNYVNWVIGILGFLVAVLGIVIAVAAYYQWWLNTKQMQRLKEDTKKEIIKEIEDSLGGSSLNNFKTDIENKVEKIEKERNTDESSRLYYELIPLQYEETFLWRIPLIIGAYHTYISDNIRNFNSFVRDVSGLITVTQNEGKSKEGIDSPHIGIIINTLTEIEKGFNEKSDELEQLKRLIDFYRIDEK
ncbi:MAG: hypothetical protein ABS913_02430 [Desemzia incerta]|uniref:hypothetical protein n=1 Tax=Desemzia incerta TaxID=82801 RepID=UPI003315D77D